MGLRCVAVWRSDTPGCVLTNDNVTVQLADTATSSSDTDPASSDSVVCMSASPSVQSGHSISFHLSHSPPGPPADADQPLLLSEHNGIGLSVSDNVNMDTDDVVFYSFHGNFRVVFTRRISLYFAFNALTLLLICQEEHSACKIRVMRCWHGYLSGVICIRSN